MPVALSHHALRLDETAEVSRLGHRLALGVQWIDALTQQPAEPLAGAAWVGELRAIGARPCVQRLEVHTQGRQALRHAGPYAKLLARAVALGDPLGHRVLGHGAREPRAGAYSVANDPRVYVPRQLSLTPVLASGTPPASTDK